MEVPGRTEFDVEENAENIDFRCEPCQSNSTTTPANGFCKDCKEFMCNTCFRQHLNLKLCKHHVLVNSDLSSLPFQRSDERKIYCKQHNGETVKFYCRDHDVVGCGDCIILQHKTCQSEYIQDLSDNFQENKEYKSLKENIEKVISNRIVLETEIQYNKKDNKLMLEKALGDIRQFRLDINEYLDKVESDVIAKVETIMRENETVLNKLENDCQTLSTKLEKITALLNSEHFKDNALFIHTVECKPMVSESEVAISNMKSKGMKKYEFVPDQQLHSLSTTAKNLGTLEISTVNGCHQTTKRTSDEGQLPTSLSTDNMCRSKSSNTHEMMFSVQNAAEKLEVSMAPSNLENDYPVETKGSDPSISVVMNESLPQWNGDMLQDVDGLKFYVEMQNIPDSETSNSLTVKLFKLKLPIVIPSLVYCDGSDTAILICDSEKDAVFLSEKKDTHFKFKRMQKKCLSGITSKLDARVWNIAKDSNDFNAFREKLRQIHVTVTENDIPEIMSNTTYQIKCARAMLAQFDSKEITNIPKEQERKTADRSVSYETVVLENVSSDVWSIVSEQAKDDIRIFENDFGNFKYSPQKKTLTISVYNGHIACAVVEKVKNRIEYFKSKDIMEIPLDFNKVKQNLKDQIPDRCKDVEEAIGYPCVVLVNDGSKVLAFAESYEQLLAIKHQILMKLEIPKPTGRSRNKAATDTEEKGSSTSTSISSLISDHAIVISTKKKLFLSSLAHREKYRLHNIDVYVCQADILTVQVECIVNAANENPSHGGGIAAVIARAAGRKLKEECDLFISKNGQLSVGQACTTKAGKLPYNYVIHTVGPRWTDYSPHRLRDIQKCENDLYHAIFNSFVEGEKYQVKKIAVPAVSSAIFGVPADICVNQYANATIGYCKKAVGVPTALSEIHFIDTNVEIVKKIQDIFNILVREGKTSPYNRNDFVKKAEKGSSCRKGSTEADKVKLGEPFFYEDKWRCMVFYVLPKSKVKIICKNDIFMEKAQGIVISVNKEGKCGALFETVLNKIRPDCSEFVTSTLKQRLRHRARIGHVEVIDGYSCGYASILFVVYPFSAQSKTHSQRKDELMHAYGNVLMEANKTGKIKSISTTLFGINSNKDEELKLAAEAFLYSYISYCEKLCNEPSLLAVKIVCQTEHTHDVVCSVFSRYVQAHKLSEENGNSQDGEENKSNENQTSETDTKDYEEETCVICMDKITDPKTLKCGHRFCTECIEQQFAFKQPCPTCFTVCGEITGDQPGGTMTVKEGYGRLEGHYRFRRIDIIYNFLPGVQGGNHPNPGRSYSGIFRTAYLPDNEEGRKIAAMLKVAFKRKLVFTIGSSRTSGQEGVITWNDIHHKTDLRPHSQVKEELTAKGVSEKDIPSDGLVDLFCTISTN